MEGRNAQSVCVRGEVCGDGLGLGGYPPSPVFEMGKIGEVGCPGIRGEALANEVGNALRCGFAVNCKRTGGGIRFVFGSR